jgi:MoaA/NifB/PqqE/SkfB family radical SAM enzyme
VPGRSVEEFAAPLLVAWQLTNRCDARCIACCEESGPDRAWGDELTREQALELAGHIADAGVPYVVFGGGEPLGVRHCWEVFERLSSAGVALKLETDGRHIDAAAAQRLSNGSFRCVQISVDGATAATHERMRPGSPFQAGIAAIERLRANRFAPQLVFVPSRFNLHEAVATYDLAVRLGCEAFVTGPMMRIGRAALAWNEIACDATEWGSTVAALRERAGMRESATRLCIYPWGILEEMRVRRASPQAMLLVVPNGKVKLLNALPFAAADLRRDSLAQAWHAYCEGWRSAEVARFIDACQANPALLRHANEIWPLQRGARAPSGVLTHPANDVGLSERT